MLKELNSPAGELKQDTPDSYSTNNDPYWNPSKNNPFTCCRWRTRLTKNCYLYKAPLYLNDPCTTIISLGAKLDPTCKYSDGSAIPKTEKA